MIEVITEDITGLDVDAIVNAANQSLLGGGGVDAAVHRAAGPELLIFNRKLGGCQVGQAKPSPGFDLKARWIIHTVGPVWQGGGNGEADLLASCYRACFRVARDKKLRTIAFPAISTGAYAYPKDGAAQIALDIMRQNEPMFERIVACCFNKEDADIYQKLIKPGT